MCLGLHVKFPLFLSHFNETWIFSTVSKNTQTWKFMKIRRVGAEVIHEDWQTEMTKIIVAFRKFANAPIKDVDELSCGGILLN
jgi:hypothetical protein